MTEADAKEAFSALVTCLTAKDLARASGRSVEAAKSWKDGTNFPSGVSLLNLARSIDIIDEWVDDAKRAPEQPNELHARMVEEAAIPGPDGDAARAYLRAWRRS